MRGTTPIQKMVKARASLVMSQPFFGSLALRLKLKEDPSCKTAWTDGVTLGFNPKYINDLPFEETKGVVAHEVLHPAFLHHLRKGARQHGRWNQACDYAINPILEEAHFALPKGVLSNPAYKGLAAEAIYTLLPEGNDGSDGDDPDPGGCGEVRTPSAKGADGSEDPSRQPSESELKQQESEWKIAVAQAAHVAKQAGKLPASMERLIEEILKPVLPWKNILRRFMTEKSIEDFTWSQPNRRFAATGLYLPARISEDALGTMAVFVDTSGSIGEELLNDFGAEISSVHKETRPRELIVVYCDADVNHVDVFGPDDEVRLEAHGGGGTDFKPPFNWLAERNIVPKCAVYLTDGYGDFPNEEDVSYPVMWALCGGSQVEPPFGETLHLE